MKIESTMRTMSSAGRLAPIGVRCQGEAHEEGFADALTTNERFRTLENFGIRVERRCKPAPIP
ncbi:hypothetical protein [Actinoplanes sp. NPDC026619]|uniref:hypothetical protein n=1 Tax=Actinoplanes sp. NPDC026619 TaxID=3155798 RepID=UPI0033C23791